MESFYVRRFVLVLLLLLPGSVVAQDRLYRWEVGPLFGLEGENSKYYEYGGRATYNFNSWLAGELQVTRLHPELSFVGRQITGIAHAKVTYRFGKSRNMGVFGIAGPGILATDAKPDPQTNLSGPFSERRLAFNFGGGFEIFPWRRVGFRADISDLTARERFLFRGNTVTRWNSWADYKVGVAFRF
jgi:hypothetical protein